MAGMAVAEGMDEMEAMKAITINAAEIIGIEDRVGSLEVGKDADVVIWNKHPFEMVLNLRLSSSMVKLSSVKVSLGVTN
jgi:imidazolonepropionase-like amidohydrolase